MNLHRLSKRATEVRGNVYNLAVKEGFMIGNPDCSHVSRRRFLAVAGTAVAANSFAVGQDASHAKTPASRLASFPYVVTIDITTNPISYRCVGRNGLVHNAYRLNMTTDDTVTWTVMTPNKPWNLTILFVRETPLADATTKLPRYVLN